MNDLLTSQASVLCLFAGSIFFMTGLLTGIWKYVATESSDNKVAPYYVSVAHRTSFMYAFAAMVLAVFAYYSIFSSTVNLISVIFPLLFFSMALAIYIIEGFRSRTNNIIRDSETPALTRIFMWSLIAGETIGSAVIIIGFYIRVVQS